MQARQPLATPRQSVPATLTRFSGKIDVPESPIVLDDSDCPGTEKYGSGCLTVYDGIVGISFRGVKHPERTVWNVQRRYLLDSQLHRFDAFPTSNANTAQQWYRLPVQPYTFVPLRLDPDQEQVMRGLIRLSELAEALLSAEATEPQDAPCDRLRGELRRHYSNFVSRWGLLTQYESYASAAFSDARTLSLTLQLESNGKTARVLHERCTFATNTDSTMFLDGDPDERVARCYTYCQAMYGQPNLLRIAQKTGLSLEVVEEAVLRLGLVLRDPNEEMFLVSSESVAVSAALEACI